MTVAVGTLQYSLGQRPVTGSGLSWTNDELSNALEGSVSDAVLDIAGTSSLDELLASLADTDFEKQSVEDILRKPVEPEGWRVGEAIAEVYLSDHRGCFFPWPDDRDLRKSGSSLPGADLVGFHLDSGVDRFAFGEIKTSSHDQYPPSAMYGETGFKNQLEDLRDDKNIRNDLVKYLGYRAPASDWSERFRNAAKRYLIDDADVRVFGVLVRDVVPDQADLRARVSSLSEGPPENMAIDLLALYLPEDTISTLGDRVSRLRNGGDA